MLSNSTEKQLTVLEPPRIAVIMVIAAHPDDIESWCAGTLAQASAQGTIVKLLLVTSGDKGTDNPLITAQEVAAIREQEAETAAKRLGITEVAFLRYPDGDVENNWALRRDLVTWIRRWRPNVLFTHDPEFPYPPYTCHRDHRVTGRAAIDCAYPLARDRLSFPEQVAEGLEPHAVSEIWLFASTAADSFVDISTSFEAKIEARLAHRSQTQDPDALREDWRKRAAYIGVPVHLSLAEAFTILHL